VCEYLVLLPCEQTKLRSMLSVCMFSRDGCGALQLDNSTSLADCQFGCDADQTLTLERCQQRIRDANNEYGHSEREEHNQHFPNASPLHSVGAGYFELRRCQIVIFRFQTNACATMSTPAPHVSTACTHRTTSRLMSSATHSAR
jgi:hypothetical protein